MMRLPPNILLLILSSFALFSCAKFGDTSVIIDDDLIYYFESFEQEAALRNVSLDLNELGISGMLLEIDDSTIIGQCSINNNGQKTVIIEPSSWSQLTELQKEFLVFHELGHCALQRTHNDAFSNNGMCISMMTSGENNCIIRYTNQNRNSYLDELFYN